MTEKDEGGAKGARLLAFDGLFAVRSCCAKPENRVRFAQLNDIVAWIEANDAWGDVLTNVPYPMRSATTFMPTNQAACSCQEKAQTGKPL